jgi:hypothetical protein
MNVNENSDLAGSTPARRNLHFLPVFFPALGINAA